ncbi:MAG: hypothetical protein ACPHUD_10690 [Porticoccaceae bacterium]
MDLLLGDLLGISLVLLRLLLRLQLLHLLVSKRTAACDGTGTSSTAALLDGMLHLWRHRLMILQMSIVQLCGHHELLLLLLIVR